MVKRPPLPPLTRVGEEKLIVHEGLLGVFTPVVAAKEEDPRTTDNLAKIVETLRREIGELSAENQALQVRLQEALSKPRSSDDFATAVQRSLDDIQAKLGDMSNPVSNFALREFRLESKVYVEVTELGTVGYRFVLPGDDVDPDALSTITLDMVPLPKTTDEQVVVPAPVRPRPLDAIPEIDPERRRLLEDRHVGTVQDFLAVATRARGMAALEALLEVDRDHLGRWMSQAQLLSIEGIEPHEALALVQAGITDLATLAAATPEDLGARMSGSARTERVTEWIAAARAFVDANRASG